MKKIKLLTLILTTIVIAGTGCLKDKGFDNHEYGINDPDGSPVGVGFTLGVKYFNSTGLTLSDQPQDLDSGVVRISLLSGKPASTDIHVQIQIDPTLLADYNAANGTSIIELDPALYSVLSTDVVIPAGKSSGIVPIRVPTTTTLDPNETYGLGIRIVSADAGYIIPSNENKILLSIAIRNIYDGDYISNGYVYHPTAPRDIIDRPKTLSTINANTVLCELGDLGGSNYFVNLSVDGSNHVTVTAAAGAAGAPYSQFDSGLPTTPPGPAYTPAWPGSADCNNTYDPGTQTFKLRYGYVGGSGYRIVEEFVVRE